MLLWPSIQILETHSLRIAKRRYFEEKLLNAKFNIKSTWKVLNCVINRKKISSKLPSTFTINNQDISDAIEIAIQFCDFFH